MEDGSKHSECVRASLCLAGVVGRVLTQWCAD